MSLKWMHVLVLFCCRVYFDYKQSNEDVTYIAVFAGIVAPTEDGYPIDMGVFCEWDNFIKNKNVSMDNIIDICIEFLMDYQKFGFDFSIVKKWMNDKYNISGIHDLIEKALDESEDFVNIFDDYD